MISKIIFVGIALAIGAFALWHAEASTQELFRYDDCVQERMEAEGSRMTLEEGWKAYQEICNYGE